MIVPLNITGATHKSRSLALSNQITRNLYPELQENVSAKSQLVLQSFPGLNQFGTKIGTNRGVKFHAGNLFKVTGTGLYTLDVLGAHTSVGTIPGTGRCIIEPIGSNLVIVTGGRVFHYSGTVTEVTDGDLESPSSAAHINNVIIYDGDGGRFVTAGVGDATSIDGLDYATAEIDADNLVRVYTFKQVAYMFGEKTTERWWFSGIGRPPLDVIQDGLINVGLLALHSVDSNENALYWLGHDNHVWSVVGGAPRDITPFNVAREIEKLTSIDAASATGFCFTVEGQNFYQINFSAMSFCYHEKSGQWFTTGEPQTRSVMDGYAYAFRKHLITDYNNGNIYELDPAVYTVNGGTMTRERVTGPLHGGLVGAPGKEIEVNRFELILESGVGGFDPMMALSTSNDGKTFSTEMWENAGDLGDFLYRVEWGPLGAAPSWLFKISTSAAFPLSIHSAAADIEIGI